MRTRAVLLGCSGIALALLVVAIIVGVVAFKRMTASVPLPPADSLMDAATVGIAELHLEPGDPWIQRIFEKDGSSLSVGGEEAQKILPADLVWTARRGGEGPETHMVSLSVSPRGRIFGMAIDFALWKMGHAPELHASRDEHGGEGITSFGGPLLPGSVFVRENQVVWASDLATARHGVDLLNAPADTREAARPPVLALIPQHEGALAAGAIANDDGAVARSLALVPGAPLSLPDQSTSVLSGLAFTFDTISPSEGQGEVILHFVQGTPRPVMEELAADLGAQITRLSSGELTLSVTTRYEDAKAVLLVRAAGLESLYDRLAAWLIQGARTIKEITEAQDDPSGSEEPSGSE